MEITMDYHSYDVVWRFDTENYVVRCQVFPCEDDPADVFEFEEDIRAVRDGEVEWFDVVVTVNRKASDREVELGRDHLGCCSYKTIDEFITGHRDPDPMNRNCSIMRQARGNNVVICEYFPGMVRQAIADARSIISVFSNEQAA